MNAKDTKGVLLSVASNKRDDKDGLPTRLFDGVSPYCAWPKKKENRRHSSIVLIAYHFVAIQ